MHASILSRPLWLVGVLGLAAAVAGLSHRSAAQENGQKPPADPWHELKYDGAAYCMTCHAQPRENYRDQGALDLVLLTEYAIWKIHDKHAQAYAVLEGPRGQEMARLLGKPHEALLNDDAVGCLNCHTMNYAAKRGRNFSTQDGVSCGGCHGPSSKWGDLHTRPDEWRKLTAETKSKAGMRDLRDPVTRAELCVSCHVGNAAEGKVVTHAMFAAGHPPLPPIELATFARNQPQHWRDARDVPYFKGKTDDPKFGLKYADKVKNYHLEDMGFQRTQLALVGSLVALRETFKLVQARADVDLPAHAVSSYSWPELLAPSQDIKVPDVKVVRQAAGARWPEVALAHSDCYACHHDLKYPGYRQERGFGYQLASRPPIRLVPGRLPVRAWPLAVSEFSLHVTGKTSALDGLEKHLKTLAQAADRHPFGERLQVGKAAREIVGWCEQALAELRTASYAPDTVLRVLRQLCQLYGAEKPLRPDYESARQLASVLVIAWEELQVQAPEVSNALRVLSRELNLQPHGRRADRLRTVAELVKDIATAKGAGIRPGHEADFLAYTNEIANVELLNKLMVNSFLTALQNNVSASEFTKRLNDPKVVVKLQAYSNEELTQALKAIAEYKPERFRAALNTVLRHLPESMPTR